MKLSVVIVNYNVRYFLEQALLSALRAAEQVETEIWVVDNASSDGAVEMVAERFPSVKLIANTDNVGFAVANNQAVAQAKGEYVLLLNPDTVVEENTFRACVDFMDAHPEAGGLGIRMLDGKGNFLPESKRGLPTPFVALWKTVGLSRLFPHSRFFNHYHLGYLSEKDTHEVEVLAGAFMLLRKDLIDRIGALDEAFFMYGEDIDLSLRILQAGYKNYYFAGSRIIHYKGESTKRGSLNYVRVFYNAMIIFARKHYSGARGRFFVLLLQAAIYFRAAAALMQRMLQHALLPLSDATLIAVGMYYLKTFWANYYFKTPDYFSPLFLQFNVPLYTAIWLTSVYFSGGYDKPTHLWRLLRGLLLGTVIAAAVYGLLDAPYRSSRALMVLGAVWASVAMVSLRFLIHWYQTGKPLIASPSSHHLLIVGSETESRRVETLLHQAQVQMNFIGVVAPTSSAPSHFFLGSFSELPALVQAFRINEIVFCAADLSYSSIIATIERLGTGLDYKIVSEGSSSIIGSNSKNTAGDLYTLEVRYRLATPAARRNKRVVDLGLCLFFVLSFPLLFWKMVAPLAALRAWLRVLKGSRTWIGYAPTSEKQAGLPKIREGVLTPASGLRLPVNDAHTLARLNFFYAKDYEAATDLRLFLRAWLTINKR